MAKMGVFVGTAGRTSMKIANAVSEAFDIDEDDVINMEDDFDDLDEMMEYDVLFLGSSTWGQGDPHFSWVDVLLDMQDGDWDFTGKTVAFFGAGDCKKHGENFCSALGKLYTAFTELGANAIGFIPKELYTYDHSLAEIDGKFCGCGIDEHNESGKTSERIDTWLTAVKAELC